MTTLDIVLMPSLLLLIAVACLVSIIRLISIFVEVVDPYKIALFYVVCLSIIVYVITVMYK